MRPEIRDSKIECPVDEIILRYIDFLLKKKHPSYRDLLREIGYTKAASIHKTLLDGIFRDYMNSKTYGSREYNNKLYEILTGDTGINVDEYAEIIHSNITPYRKTLDRQLKLLKSKYNFSIVKKENKCIEDSFIQKDKLVKRVRETFVVSDEEIKNYCSKDLVNLITDYSDFVEDKIKHIGSD